MFSKWSKDKNTRLLRPWFRVWYTKERREDVLVRYSVQCGAPTEDRSAEHTPHLCLGPCSLAHERSATTQRSSSQVIYHFYRPSVNWWRPCGRPHSHRKNFVRYTHQQINRALKEPDGFRGINTIRAWDLAATVSCFFPTVLFIIMHFFAKCMLV